MCGPVSVRGFVLVVDGGEATYLCHWVRESGLAALLPSLSETVWVGVSAGSMVLTPRIGIDFVASCPLVVRSCPRGAAVRQTQVPATGSLCTAVASRPGDGETGTCAAVRIRETA